MAWVQVVVWVWVGFCSDILECYSSGLSVLLLVVGSWDMVLSKCFVGCFLEDSGGVVRVLEALEDLLLFDFELVLRVANDEGAKKDGHRQVAF